MDRDSPEVLPQMQLNFVDYLVKPLFSMLVKTLPRTEECITNLCANRNAWSECLVHND
jgi:hypothetical protein